MIRKIVFTLSFIFLSTPSFPETLTLVPSDQTTDSTFVVYLNAGDLVSARGFDIVITWNENVIECSSMRFDESALPGFSEFLRIVDNGTGRVEVVLLRILPGGFSGDVDSFLELKFDPVSPGTTFVEISNTLIAGDPLLINSSNNGIEVETSSARVIVSSGETPPVAATMLYQNFPNPFNPGTTIRFDVSKRSPVGLRIFDVGGRFVRTLISGEIYETGSWETDWDGRNNAGNLVPSGIYFCVLDAAGVIDSRKLVMIR